MDTKLPPFPNAVLPFSGLILFLPNFQLFLLRSSPEAVYPVILRNMVIDADGGLEVKVIPFAFTALTLNRPTPLLTVEAWRSHFHKLNNRIELLAIDTATFISEQRMNYFRSTTPYTIRLSTQSTSFS